jgi:hypothetical protein
VYGECSATASPLLSPTRYTDYLVEALREGEGREVLMVAFTGVPPIEQRSADPPFQPTDGGLPDLIYHTWEISDLVPPDVDAGMTVDDKRFAFGMGPGCTDYDDGTGRLVQAVPNVRITDVCQALDLGGDLGNAGVRCCIESVCDPGMAFDCVDGWLSANVLVPGG